MKRMNPYFEAIAVIADGCLAEAIPFNFHNLDDGWQLTFPWSKGDVACTSYTSCSDLGLVETYQFSWDNKSVTQMLPAEAMRRIRREYYGYLAEQLYK